jgi:photosystem II stability/assembly factor-like uncharacterized protein
MFTIDQPNRTLIILLAGSLFLFAACSGSSNGSNFAEILEDPPPGDPPPDDPPPAGGDNPPETPVAVTVIAGDDDSGDVQNTISWALDPDVTEYTVFWSNAPGVTENSSILVPTFAGTRYNIHSGADVVAGNTYYYRVRATSAGGDSALSDEIAATPQTAITNNALNDVAWNGVDTLVAVADSGVILSSPNATADPWIDTSLAAAAQPLTGVTWENVNSQFLIVGASSTVLTGDGTNWNLEDLSNLAGSSNLQDVAFFGDKYIAVGNNATILASNIDGSAWEAQDVGPVPGATSFNAVATNNDRIVVVGSNGTVVTSVDGFNWEEQLPIINNNLNDVTWDGSQFMAVGSNDTVFTSPDGLDWTAHIPGTADINLVAVTQFDSGLPQNPTIGAVGSSGTLVFDPDAGPGNIVFTGTTRMLSGMTWVDDGAGTGYFVMVGSDGTVLTAR